MKPPNPLCVALDVPTSAQAVALARAIGDAAGLYKIGLEQFMAEGPEAVHAIGRAVFLDVKLHDIPTTVSRALRALAPLGAALVNVHALGGRAMLEAAATAKGSMGLLAVTILTSMDEAACKEVGLPPPSEAVPLLARTALEAGCDGVVCAPTDLAAVRALCPPPFLCVTPGIRPAGAGADDQARTATPAAALAAGADIIVVGRPVTAAANPRAAAEAIVKEIG